MKSAYRQFLEGKIVIAERHGFDVAVEDIHPECFPHQKDAIRWAAGLGRALIAMSFGLGKTRIQCELARLVHVKTNRMFLVERTIRLYSNTGDLVLDPFAGLFTVPVTAMKLGRVGMGIELNHDYYAAGLKYCEMTQQEKLAPTLFDLLQLQEA